MSLGMMLTTAEPIYSTLLDDPEMFELVELFVSELPERLAQLEQAHSSGNMSELGRFAHQLKGAAGSYGFDAVTPFAARVERTARSGEPENVVRGALMDLLEICARLRGGLPVEA